MDPRFSNLIEKNGILNFKLEGINVSLANALRRTIISDIDTVVIKTFPHSENQANIMINTTRFNNEILKPRLSCIPIHIQDLETPLEESTNLLAWSPGDALFFIHTKSGLKPKPVTFLAVPVPV